MRGRLIVLVGLLVAGGGVALSQGRAAASVDCLNVVNQGSGNSAATEYKCATVGGGQGNTASGDWNTIGGGQGNTTSGGWNTIGGGESNTASAVGTTVGGGLVNAATGTVATIGGGSFNTALSTHATVGGGGHNEASGFGTTVAGGYRNRAAADFATIAGGGATTLSGPGYMYTGNRVYDSYGAVGGGGYNQAGKDGSNTEDARFATVSGGFHNAASEGYATIGGGSQNAASGHYAAVGGGRQNAASGLYATIAGGYQNAASGSYSFAAGRQAQATQAGSFVWGDNQAANVASTAPNQFVVRAKGGIWLGKTSTVPSPSALKFIDTSTGAYLSSGGVWTNVSDRTMKANFTAVDSQSVLERVAAMPIQLWTYKSQDASIKHIGPMAQDFAAAFGVGEDDKHISTVDADGVALAAIQGLNQKVDEKDAQIAALQERLAVVEATQRSSSPPLQVAPTGLTLSWSAIALALALLVASAVSLTLLLLRRRTTPA